MASSSAPHDARMSSDDSDSDYEPAEEEQQSEEESRAQAYFERLLAEGMEENDEAEDEGEDGENSEGNELEFGDIQVEIEEEPNNLEETQAENAERIARTRRRVLRLLQNSEIGRIFRFAPDDDEDDEDGWNPRWTRQRHRPDPHRFPKVPSDVGTELMESGSFGINPVYAVNSREKMSLAKKKKLAWKIMERELAVDNPAREKLNRRLLAQGMIPSTKADIIIHYDEPVYSGQFSDDGNFFFSANKDYHVRMYDTSNPYQWEYYKTVAYPFGQWTLTDATLSPDNKYLAYTSIKSQVCLAPTDPNDKGDPYTLDLADMGQGRPNIAQRLRFGGSFGIWSIRYSGDGQRLVAGTTGGSIVVYDIESRRSLHRIFGHDEDVNAVCFADSASPHILYSGSDDTTLKVWDTRSLGDSRSAGALIGHIEGLTYIDSKGDGRYILSNGKDQSMKLWDVRKLMSSAEFERIKPQRRATSEHHFDYRWGSYDEDDWYQDPHDNSLVTFRGHKVLRTLIRCHFSPPGSTNSRYVYSGSEDGKVYIWNMDATPAGTIDVHEATKDSRPLPDTNYDMGWENTSPSQWKTCVRDASWHPSAPVIAASAWSGYGMSTGTCTAHSWNDGAKDDEGVHPKMGARVNEKLDHDPEFYSRSSTRVLRSRMRFR